MADHKMQKGWDGPVEYSYIGLTLAVLVEVRDELKKLNALLHCDNFIRIPTELKHIRRNTTKKRRPK